MRDRLKLASRFGIAEHPFCQLLAIERAIGREYFAAKVSHDLGQPVAAWQHHLASREIRIHAPDALFPQRARDGALAACDAAGQAEDEHCWMRTAGDGMGRSVVRRPRVSVGDLRSRCGGRSRWRERAAEWNDVAITGLGIPTSPSNYCLSVTFAT